MKTIDEYAKEANRQVGRWYGQRMLFSAPRSVSPSCEEWFKAHWRRFPSTDPAGGEIVDGVATEIVGFLE